MKLWLGAILESTLKVVAIILYALAFLLHIWTTVIAYEWSESSFIVGLTFLFPVISEVFWIIFLWSKTGIFFTPYAIVVIVFTIIVLVTMITSTILENSDVEV
ncbi:MAG TPA: hypothetical protein VLJ61_12735 [Pyrinomonadaceae bacterium]|nr:hypothetical protein [Pyrinomonadaceae bacterium]